MLPVPGLAVFQPTVLRPCAISAVHVQMCRGVHASAERTGLVCLTSRQQQQTHGHFYKRPTHLQVRKRWCNTDTLLIDEISMIDAELFDKARATLWKRCTLPLEVCAMERINVCMLVHACRSHRASDGIFACRHRSVLLPQGQPLAHAKCHANDPQTIFITPRFPCMSGGSSPRRGHPLLPWRAQKECNDTSRLCAQVDYVARACRAHRQLGAEAEYQFALSPNPFGGMQARSATAQLPDAAMFARQHVRTV